ncbi:hypothetical protein W02_02480 [Nitrospira sp. KM1]|uniref:sensor histidine kinase n=1 Tax=Nitrospira sp. KM1 TaxID=1936990 RepID=UPI0013A74085|nr:ATP-binding protein [Nitrospira sp. KM1]BCA53108.1 hypothetical protein W02_02480 [Nitrospira sp. KM1]
MTSQQLIAERTSQLNGGRGFIGLRTKFVVFFSMILILTCSALSLYFIETRRASMTEELNRLGSILLTSLVNNGRFRYGALIAEDRATLQQFTESLIAVEEVVYVVIRGTDGMILAQQNKLVRESLGSLTFTQERRFYPEERIAQELYRSPVHAPVMTAVELSQDKILVPTTPLSVWSQFFSPLRDNLYDFALPVMRRPAFEVSPAPLPFEFDESADQRRERDGQPVQGVVQIGISDAQTKRALFEIMRHVLGLTLLIIVAGIVGAHILTSRITIPLRSLATTARQLAEGGTPPALPYTTRDEVGQLTGIFNVMTAALQERNVAITNNLETIRRQIGQLTSIHQTSAAISSTLDLHQLMDTVLQLLMANLGLSRMMLMLKHEDRHIAYVARVAGVDPEIADAAKTLRITFHDDDTLLAELLIHAKPVLAPDINAVSHRMHPAILELARRIGVVSFVCVPLQSHNRILGFISGDRGPQSCTTEDLDILSTIAGHVATALDNARAYEHLARLTENLEHSIEERTRELSVANERLQDHDRRRTMFISVASHELRTPMTVIRSFADNMLDGVAGALTDRQSIYLERIQHNLNRLTRIINQLLDWSRLDLKKEELHLEPLFIKDLTAAVIETLRSMADEKRIALTLETPDYLPMVMGDRDKIEQILWNLVVNAIKFTQPDGSVMIFLAALPAGFVQICVADTGCGIPHTHLHKVFDEFSKVPSVFPGSQGAQLGLFITKSFVTMQKGTIWVTSEEQKGTKFYFTLPVAPLQPGGSSSSAQEPSRT